MNIGFNLIELPESVKMLFSKILQFSILHALLIPAEFVCIPPPHYNEHLDHSAALTNGVADNESSNAFKRFPICENDWKWQILNNPYSFDNFPIFLNSRF